MKSPSHPFHPLIVAHLAAAWIAGTAAAAVFGHAAWPLAIALGAFAATFALARREARLAVYVVALPVLFGLGAVRYEGSRPQSAVDGASRYNDGVAVRLRGTLRDDPDVGDTSQRFALSVRAVQERGDWTSATDGVLVRTGLLPRYRSGDVLELEGKLESPPAVEGFDYADYLARKGISSVMAYPSARVVGHEDDSLVRATVLRVRRRASRALALALPEPQSSLAQGVLLGQRSALPAGLAADLNTTNTSHLVVVSGENVVLVAAFATLFFSLIAGRRSALMLSIAAVLAYAALIGPSPPVVRAVIMGILMMTATILGRRSSAFTALLFAAAIMLAADPQTVRDVSFQLSFAATAGIVYLASPVKAWLVGLLVAALRLQEVPRWLAALFAEPLGVTIAAIVSTSPLLALNFGRLSLVAVPANMLVVPAFPLILAASLVAAAGGLLPHFRLVFAAPAYYLLTYWIDLARWFASVPHAAVTVEDYSELGAAITYAVLAVAGFLLLRFLRPPIESRLAERRPLPVRRVWGLAVLGLPLVVLVGSVGAALWPASPPRLSVTVLDVGQGDAILIRTPDGRDVLVDGGPGGAVLRGLGDKLPWTDRSIELLVLTHPQADHALGLLDVLERYDVREVLAGPAVEQSATYRAWRGAIENEGARVEIARQGMRFDLGDGAVMDVLGPDDREATNAQINNTGVVLKVSWRDVSFLLTADIDANGERALLDDGVDLKSTVLKVPHHGSSNSSTPGFLAAVEPNVSVVSSGQNNPFGHPAGAVVERLDAYGPLYNTATSGSVHFETDGYQLWIDTQR